MPQIIQLYDKQAVLCTAGARLFPAAYYSSLQRGKVFEFDAERKPWDKRYIRRAAFMSPETPQLATYFVHNTTMAGDITRSQLSSLHTQRFLVLRT